MNFIKLKQLVKTKCLAKNCKKKRSDKMKVTIKKLSKMGLSKDQIKEVLELDEEQYQKYSNNKTAFIRENLPKKIDYILKGGNLIDFKLSDIFDKIYILNGLEVLGLETKKKVELIREFPGFIKYIEMKRISDQIEILNCKKAELEKETITIDEKINSLKLKNGLISGAIKVEKKIEEKQSKIPTLIIDKDIKIYKNLAGGNKQGHIKKVKSTGLEIGDYFKLVDDTGIIKFQIYKSYQDGKLMSFKFIEKIMSKGA